VDFRLSSLALATWLSAAIVITSAGLANPIWASAMCATFILLARVFIRRFSQSQIETTTLVAVILLGTLLGSAVAAIRITPLATGPIAQASQSNSVVSGVATITSDPILTQSKDALDWNNRQLLRVTLRIDSLTVRDKAFNTGSPVMSFITDPELISSAQHYIPGQRIEFSGKLSPAPIGKPFAAYLKLLESPDLIQAAPGYQMLAADLRSGLHESLRFSSQAAQGLVPGLALGDSSALQPELADQMKAAGLTHLIAVSGTNVTLLIVVVLAVLRKFRVNRNWQYLITVISLFAFVILVRPQPSVLRATVMGLVALAATYSKSNRSPLPALSVAVISLVALDPWLAVSYGFALSVAATAGLILWVNRIQAFLDRTIPKRVPLWIIQTLTVTIAAQFSVFPILVALGSPISLSSIPANMLAVPLAGPAMVLGLLAALVTPFSQVLGILIAWLSGCFAQLIAFVAQTCAAIDWLLIPWPSGKPGIALALISISGVIQIGVLWRQLSKAQQSQAVSMLLTGIVLIWINPTFTLKQWPAPNWVMVSCDVGQGDATVIRVGPNEAVVVDVGGDAKAIDRCLNDLHIKRIPVLLLTHFHADHVGGLEGAIGNREIGQIRVSPLNDPPSTTEFVNDVLRKLNRKSTVMTYPERFVVNGVSVTCIWPSELITGQGSDANNASVALAVEVHGVSILLAGDIEPPAQDQIVRNSPAIDFDVIKVAHHGSRYQSSDFAKWANADIAFISAGKDNDYGHPAPETISLYELTGSQVFRTDLDGDLAIMVQDSQIRVATRQ
jgi:competence protein ComEC